MTSQKAFLVDVGVRDLPFPIKAASRDQKEGQATVAEISISARIMREFEAHWIDTFIHTVHRHRELIGAMALEHDIGDYIKALQASAVTLTFDFPFFYEKTTPVSQEKCLVRYHCSYTVKANSLERTPHATLKVGIPALTTYPVSTPETKGGLFSQLSIITLEVEPRQDIFPEELIDLVDRHALAPVYSFLTVEDQLHLIHKAHSEHKTNVTVVGAINDELAHHENIEWFSVSSTNYGMLHSYSTMVSTEKSMWVPFADSAPDEDAPG